jgi:hypothetical protein
MKRVDFVEMLVLVAQSCNFDLSEQLIAIYDQALAKNGYPKLCAALKHILINRRTRDPFPSIREVQEIVAPTLATKDQANGRRRTDHRIGLEVRAHQSRPSRGLHR